MPDRFAASSSGSQNTSPSQLRHPPPRVSNRLLLTRYFGFTGPVLIAVLVLIMASNSANTSPTVVPVQEVEALALSPAEQNVQRQVSWIRNNLPLYLDFVGREVLPVMSENIDQILHDLGGLTVVRPGFFYHGHIDYSTDLSGGMIGLLQLDNVVLQYHTLENPRIYIAYWRQQLRAISHPNIQAWLDGVDQFNQAITTPRAASQAPYSPLTAEETYQIAQVWNTHLQQRGLATPGTEMLANMVYLIDGGRQPHYEESFRNINRFHSIAFHGERYLPLDGKAHLDNTFSPFQVTFELVSKCHALLPIFDDARAAHWGYIVNLSNPYVAPYPELMQDPDMLHLSQRLQNAIAELPDDNLIRLHNPPGDKHIAFFAVGNYVFAVYGSLDSPSIFP